jgi:hypothetical protein
MCTVIHGGSSCAVWLQPLAHANTGSPSIVEQLLSAVGHLLLLHIGMTTPSDVDTCVHGPQPLGKQTQRHGACAHSFSTRADAVLFGIAHCIVSTVDNGRRVSGVDKVM